MERVREILVLKPGATREVISKAIENDPKAPMYLSPEYVGKLIRKIHGERINRFTDQIVSLKLAELQDSTRLVAEQMWSILLDSTADEKARVAAGKMIIDSEHRLIEAMMTAGIFKKQLGTLKIEGSIEHEHEHRIKLAPEIKEPILRALQNYGLIRNAKYKIAPPTPTATKTA